VPVLHTLYIHIFVNQTYYLILLTRKLIISQVYTDFVYVDKATAAHVQTCCQQYGHLGQQHLLDRRAARLTTAHSNTGHVTLTPPPS